MLYLLKANRKDEEQKNNSFKDLSNSVVVYQFFFVNLYTKITTVTKIRLKIGDENSKIVKKLFL